MSDNYATRPIWLTTPNCCNILTSIYHGKLKVQIFWILAQISHALLETYIFHSLFLSTFSLFLHCISTSSVTSLCRCYWSSWQRLPFSLPMCPQHHWPLIHLVWIWHLRRAKPFSLCLHLCLHLQHVKPLSLPLSFLLPQACIYCLKT